jgi:predicted nucleic acid-binding protein
VIIVDSGFWFGLFDRGDSNHLICKKFLMQCTEPLITTFPVLTETLHLLIRRKSAHLTFDLLNLLQQLQQHGDFSIFSLHESHLVRLRELMK